MKTRLLALLLILTGSSAYAQTWDQVNGSMQVKSGPSAPLVIVDQTAAGQKIQSWRNNGTERCYIDVSGNFSCSGGYIVGGQILGPDGSASAPTYSFASDPDTGLYSFGANQMAMTFGGSPTFTFSGSAFTLGTDTALLRFGANADLTIAREAADHWFQRRTTNAQRASWANTYTSSTNYEAFSVDWQTTANVALVGTRTAATGTARAARFLSQASSGANVYGGIVVQSNDVGAPFFRAGLFDSGLTNSTTGVTGNWFVLGQFTSSATSGTNAVIAITPTYNQSSGTAANTDLLINRTQTAVGSGAQYSIQAQIGGTNTFAATAGTTGKGTQLSAAQVTVPTCSSNCGTSPTVVGSDTAMRVTMGATGVPASGWVVTFNGTWAAAPSCHVTPGLAGMAVGKLPIVVATTTTTLTVTTNGTAPANSDIYNILCLGVQ